MSNKDNREEKISSEEIFKGKILDVYLDKVKLPNGNESTREVVRHCKASAVLAFDIKGDVIIEEQFRYPYDDTIIEIPAGKCDKGEKPIDAAIRELKEETGYSAKYIELLGTFYPSVAYTDEIIYLYLATGLTKGEQHLDKDETLEYKKVSFKKLLNMIDQGKIQDGKTLAAVTYYLIKHKKIKSRGHLSLFSNLINKDKYDVENTKIEKEKK